MIGLWSLCLFVSHLAFQQGSVKAWSPDGHERIARIAERLLTGKHKDQIRTMMGGRLIDMADWEKKMVAQFPESETLHFHRQQPEWSCGKEFGLGDSEGHLRCDEHGAENGSLFCALAYFFEHFAHDALLGEYPAPKDPIGTPKSLKVLDNLPSTGKSVQNYLRWLVILLGDLHQPLHWLHEHSFGQDIMINYDGLQMTLYNFWENFLPEHFHKLKKGLHPHTEDASHSGWDMKAPTELFRDWAKEEAAKVCEEVYAPMTVNHADGTRVDSPFYLTEELFQKWVALAERLATLAGERLAFILNEIIEHKRHKEADADGRSLPSRKVAVGTAIVASKPEEIKKADAKAERANKKAKEAAKSAHAKKVAAREATNQLFAGAAARETIKQQPDKGKDFNMTPLEELPSFEEFDRIHAKKFGPARTLKIASQGRSSRLPTNLGIAVVLVPAILFTLSRHAEQSPGKSSRGVESNKRDI